MITCLGMQYVQYVIRSSTPALHSSCLPAPSIALPSFYHSHLSSLAPSRLDSEVTSHFALPLLIFPSRILEPLRNLPRSFRHCNNHQLASASASSFNPCVMPHHPLLLLPSSPIPSPSTPSSLSAHPPSGMTVYRNLTHQDNSWESLADPHRPRASSTAGSPRNWPGPKHR